METPYGEIPAQWIAFGPNPATSMWISFSSGTYNSPGSAPNPQVRYGLDTSYGATASASGSTVPVPASPWTPVAGDTDDTIYINTLLTGLSPQTTYHYSVSLDGVNWGADTTFTTGKTGVQNFRFAATGDEATSTTSTEPIVASIADYHPDFTIVAGDLSYASGGVLLPPGGGTQPSYSPSAWDTYFSILGEFGAQSIPWIVGVGNHEMEPLTNDGYAGVLTRFPDLAANASSSSGSPVARTFTYGNVAFVQLDGNDLSAEISNNNGYTGGTQTSWLSTTLAGYRATGSGIDFIVVYFHNRPAARRRSCRGGWRLLPSQPSQPRHGRVIGMSNASHLGRKWRRSTKKAVALGAAGLFTFPFWAGTASAAGGFTAGDLVVYRVGTGSAPLTSASTAVFLDEYPTTPGSPTSTPPVFSLPLPIATSSSNDAVTASGSATSEGELTLSSDGTVLLATGYDAAPGVTSITGTTSANDPRVVAEINANGNINSATAFSSLYSANNIRGAASTNGSTIYAAGPTNGVVETPEGNTSTAVQLTPAGGDVNFRVAQIYGGQLYASSASGSGSPDGYGIDSIGTGLPVAASSPPYTNLSPVDNGSSSDSPYGFVLFNETGGAGPDTAYVADSSLDEVLKYVLNGTTWVFDGASSSSATTGVTGLTGTYSGGTATLYATSPTSLVSITDTTGQGTLTAAPVTLATAATNEAFRGVAFAPSAAPVSTPEAPLTIGLPLLALATFGAGAFVMRRRHPRETV